MEQKSWVDFRLVKQTVSMEMVLGHYGVTNLKRTGNELRGPCPIHKGDGPNAFHVNVAKNCFQCFVTKCKRRGNVLDFVAAMESCTVRDAALKLQSWFGSEPTASGTGVQPSTAHQPPNAKVNNTVVNPPLSFTLKGIDPAHPYLSSRGIDQPTAERFGIGFFSGRGSMSGRVVIPIHNERGDLIAYAGRLIDDANEPRYKLPAGFVKSAVLYNLHRVLAEQGRGPVVVVEGFFDCVRVSIAGFRCVALMGSSLSSEQEELLAKHFRAVCLMLDDDESGRAGSEDAARRLVARMYTKSILLPQGAQPDQIGTTSIKEIMK